MGGVPVCRVPKEARDQDEKEVQGMGGSRLTGKEEGTEAQGQDSEAKRRAAEVTHQMNSVSSINGKLVTC